MPVNSRPSFLQTIKEGLAFGVGNSIGHRIVGAVSGEPTPRVGAVSGEPTPRVGAASGEPTLRVGAVSGEPTLRVGMMTSQTEKPTATGSEKPQEEYEQCMKKYDDVTCERILEAKN
jgi:hypothetical protein